MWALAISLVTFVASLGLLAWFDRGAGGEQFLVDVPWISSPDIHFAISVERRQPLAGAALDVPDAALRADLLALHSEAA